MKQRVLGFLVVLAVVACVGYLQFGLEREPLIVGKWVGSLQGHQISMEFAADGALVIGAFTGAEKEEKQGTYDLQVSPDAPEVYLLDFTIENQRVKTIVKFETPDELVVQNFDGPDQPRPTTFNERAFTLRRATAGDVTAVQKTLPPIVGKWVNSKEAEQTMEFTADGTFHHSELESMPYRVRQSELGPEVFHLSAAIGMSGRQGDIALIQFETDDRILWRDVPMTGPRPTLADEVDFELRRVGDKE